MHDHAVVAAYLKRFGVTLGSATEPISDSSTGKLMKNILASFAYYRCRSSACKAVNVRRGDLESTFVEYLDALVPKPEYVRLLREIVLDVWKRSRPTRPKLDGAYSATSMT